MKCMPSCLLLFVGFAVGACDYLPRTPHSAPEPMAQEASATPDELASSWRYGVVTWQSLDSDCPADGAWVEDEIGMVLVDGDEVTLVLETTPELYGTVADGRVAFTGEVEFPGETGANVTCAVAGSAVVAEDHIAGTMDELMTSVGDLNCTSRGAFRFLFDR